MIRIVHSRILGGWFIVRGPHQTPISGRFDSRAAAALALARREGWTGKLIEGGRPDTKGDVFVFADGRAHII